MRANKFIARCYDCYPVETDTSMFEKEIASADNIREEERRFLSDFDIKL